MQRSIAWFIGSCAVWWFACAMFPLGAYMVAGAVLSRWDGAPEIQVFLLAPLAFAVLGAIPVAIAATKNRLTARLTVWLGVTVLLFLCLSGISVAQVMWLCRASTNGCAPA
jgi:hypothetical protein